MDQGRILESWKEIAAHLRRNVRTCQMWERKMGLPIHRLDGSPKARVFAYPEELDRWLDEKLHEREPGEAIPEPRKPPDKAEGQPAALRSERRHAVLPTLPRWSSPRSDIWEMFLWRSLRAGFGSFVRRSSEFGFRMASSQRSFKAIFSPILVWRILCAESG